MLSYKDIQSALKVMDPYAYNGAIDGILGPKTHEGIKKVLTKRVPGAEKWSQGRRLVAFQQLMMKDLGLDVGEIDGLNGPQTRYAVEQWQDRQRDIPSTSPPPAADSPKPRWPTQSGVPAFYGSVGKNQTLVEPPYTMYLYDTRQVVRHLSLHVKVADSAVRVLTKVKEVYGESKINELHLNRFFGSLNVRKMRGGSSWSMHSWGIAIDFDANRNQLRWGRDKAAFAKAEYDPWWQAWEAEGWVSLGREKNYDWMHVQAARL